MRKELLGIEHFVAAEEESKRETLRKAYLAHQQKGIFSSIISLSFSDSEPIRNQFSKCLLAHRKL